MLFTTELPFALRFLDYAEIASFGDSFRPVEPRLKVFLLAITRLAKSNISKSMPLR
jgi:hypothetical protein